MGVVWRTPSVLVAREGSGLVPGAPSHLVALVFAEGVILAPSVLMARSDVALIH